MSDWTSDWSAANQRYLAAAVGVVRARFAAMAGPGETEDRLGAALAEQEAARAALPSPSALDLLAETFDLSPFERELLVAAAGVELDSGFAAEVAPVTFGRALAALAEAHWSALSPGGPLRRWRLIEVGSGSSLTGSALRIDERILHHLAGVAYLDDRLAGYLEAVGEHELVPSHQRLAGELAAVWARAASPLPILHLAGGDAAVRRGVAASAAAALGLGLYALPAALLPLAADELDGLVRLWERESVLTQTALAVEVDDLATGDTAREAVLARLLDTVRGPLFVSGGDRRPPRHRPLVAFAVEAPTSDEQRALWQQVLAGAEHALDGQVDALVGNFRLSPGALRTAGARALASVGGDGDGAADAARNGFAGRLWKAAREQARPRLEGLAQRLEPAAGWDDLVLPPAERRTLAELAVQVRRRLQVFESWGFASRSRRGLGVSALFSGLSGTGKTMAAEALAGELDLDLYRIDLAAIISKYIGETEKNLSRVFDAADDGGAILLFDEADALFGKRSEVKDSHDRYANIEVGYLLQRMESYRGLAILTSNMKSALDTAFLRRLRFVVEFPFPDAPQRAEIWRRVFPPETPTDGLDPELLGRLSIAGGSIRNIALGAAFLAAEEGCPVGMEHLLRASRSEMAKLDKPLNEAEVRGWV